MNGIKFGLNFSHKAKDSAFLGRSVTIKAKYGDRFPRRIIPFMVHQVLKKFNNAIFINKEDKLYDLISKGFKDLNPIIEVKNASMEGVSMILARVLLADRIEVSDINGEFNEVHLPVEMLDQLRETLYKELEDQSNKKKKKNEDNNVEKVSESEVKKE